MNTLLIEKILSGSASKKEKEEFDSWLNESETNKEKFESMKLLWDKAKRIPLSKSFDEISARNKIMQKVHRKRLVAARARTRRIWISTAATVLILLGIGSLIINNEDLLFQETITYTAQNEVKQVILPDGTQVWLNANSTLSAPEYFRKNKRNVKLSGEAYFEVTRDESRPFQIRTGETFTKVLGTSFNIKMDTIQNNVSIIVNTGRVAFYHSKHEQDGAILIAGDRANFLYETEKISKNLNHDLNYLSWKTGILRFKNTPLDEVCMALKNYYNCSVNTKLNDPDYVITGIFKNESLETILTTIQLTLDLKIVYENSQITITQ